MFHCRCPDASRWSVWWGLWWVLQRHRPSKFLRFGTAARVNRLRNIPELYALRRKRLRVDPVNVPVIINIPMGGRRDGKVSARRPSKGILLSFISLHTHMYADRQCGTKNLQYNHSNTDRMLSPLYEILICYCMWFVLVSRFNVNSLITLTSR